MSTVESSAENQNAHIARGTTVLFPGTPHAVVVQTGKHVVTPGGAGRFTGSEWTSLGCDDADKLRAEASGQPVPRPWHVRVTEARERHAREVAKTLNKRRGEAEAATGVVAAPAAPGVETPETRLAKQLEVFKDDPAMQLVVFQKWQKENAPLSIDAPAKPVGVEQPKDAHVGAKR